jgi:AsmA protein
MKRCRFRRWSLIPLGLLLTPLLVWVGIVLIAPTDWARTRIAAALARSSRRTVHIDRLDVCLLGGIRLKNLEIGSPATVEDPWFRSSDLALDISLLQLLRGRLEPTSLRCEGASLRILRRADGSLELEDLVQFDDEQASTEPHDPDRCEGPAHLEVRLRGSRITLVDERTRSQLVLENVAGVGIWEHSRAVVQRLVGELSDGTFEFSGELDGSDGTPRFEGRLEAKDVALTDGMLALRYVVPVLAGPPAELDGRLAAEARFSGHGLDAEGLRSSLKATGRIALDPIQLRGIPVVAELARLLDLPSQARAGSVRTEFVVSDGRVRTDHVALNLGRFPVELAGWTDFDGVMDYHLNVDGLADRIPSKVRTFLADLDLDPSRMSTVRLAGTVDDLKLDVDGTLLKPGALSDPVEGRVEREKLRVLGRRLRDKIFR